MREGMGGSTIYGHFGTYPYARNHISDLGDNMVGEEPPAIIFKHGHEHRKHGRYHP